MMTMVVVPSGLPARPVAPFRSVFKSPPDDAIPANTVVLVHEFKGKWVRVQWGSKCGWLKLTNLQPRNQERPTGGCEATHAGASSDRLHAQDYSQLVNSAGREDDPACTLMPNMKRLKQLARAPSVACPVSDTFAIAQGISAADGESMDEAPLDDVMEGLSGRCQRAASHPDETDRDLSSRPQARAVGDARYRSDEEMDDTPPAGTTLIPALGSSIECHGEGSSAGDSSDQPLLQVVQNDCDICSKSMFATKEKEGDIENPPNWVRDLQNDLLSLVIKDPNLEPVMNVLTVWPRLYGFQQEGVAFAASRGGRVLIADEMGLGKTIQALALVAQYVENLPVLVVVPTYLSAQWQKLAVEWLCLCPDDVQIVKNTKSSIIHNKKIVIISYELLRMDAKFQLCPAGRPWQMLICDESHRLKNRESDRFKAVLPIAQAARRVILLSGTPMPNSHAEIWAQLSLLLPPGRLPCFEEFADRYTTRKDSKRFGVLWKGFRRSLELKEFCLRHVMIERRKADVLTQLPPLQQHCVNIVPSRAVLPDLSDKNRWASETCDTKLSATIEYIKGVLATAACQDCKLVLFAHHHRMIDALEESVCDAQIKSIRIDGRVPKGKRETRIARFQRKKRVRVAICSIAACSEGVSLTAATLVIFCELHWTPAVLAQCAARVHRSGQIHPVEVRFIVAEGTLDEWVWRTLQEKRLGPYKAVEEVQTACTESAVQDAENIGLVDVADTIHVAETGDGGETERPTQPRNADAGEVEAPTQPQNTEPGHVVAPLQPQKSDSSKVEAQTRPQTSQSPNDVADTTKEGNAAAQVVERVPHVGNDCAAPTAADVVTTVAVEHHANTVMRVGSCHLSTPATSNAQLRLQALQARVAARAAL